jgi:hypothetical protein
MGILLDGLALFILIFCIIIVMVTIYGCIQFLRGCCVCFELPFGHCVSSRAMCMVFSPHRGLILVILVSKQLVMGWPLCQEVCVMVVGNTWGLHFHWHGYKIGSDL